MSIVTQLKPRPATPARTPDRERLAGAIDHMAALADRRERVLAATENASNRSLELHGTIKTLRGEIEEAQAAETKAVVARMIMDPVEESHLPELTSQLEQATREHATLVIARNQLAEELKAVDYKIGFAKDAVERAVIIVLQSSGQVAAVFAAFEVARAQYEKAGSLLCLLRAGLPDETRKAMIFPNCPKVPDNHPWAVALESLAYNPDTKFPE